METTVIRTAKKEDCAQMMNLVHELAEHVGKPEKVVVDLAHFEEMGFGPTPIWQAFVAEQAGEVVGLALYFPRYATWTGAQFYLEDLVVTHKLRGQGIGKLLLDRLIEEAKTLGLKGVVWQVVESNTGAIRFYEQYEGVEFEKGQLNVVLGTKG